MGEAAPQFSQELPEEKGPELTLIDGKAEGNIRPSFQDLVGEARTLSDFRWWPHLVNPEVSQDIKGSLIAANPQYDPPMLSPLIRKKHLALHLSLPEPLIIESKFQPLLDVVVQNPVVEALQERQLLLASRSREITGANQELNDSLTIITKLTLAELLNDSYDPYRNENRFDWPQLGETVKRHFGIIDKSKKMNLN